MSCEAVIANTLVILGLVALGYIASAIEMRLSKKKGEPRNTAEMCE
jgi:hypothetical protein